MLQLLLGLVMFFGIHSVAIVALPLRDRMAARSELGWKAMYGITSLIGIVLIAGGYSELRLTPTVLYVPPVGLRHLAAILMLPVFAFFIASYFPGRIKQALKHPQLAAVKLWALAHLLMNGNVADVLLFGSFLVWAVLDRASMKGRAARPLPGAPESKANDIIVVVAGLLLYVAFVFWGHEALIGMKPFAGIS
jgi:uncharacterized membrane protein